MPIIYVKCSFIVPVEVPEDEEDGYDAIFDIEENHCPGTGLVGTAFDKAETEARAREGFCWACALKGKNEIVDKDGN